MQPDFSFLIRSFKRSPLKAHTYSAEEEVSGHELKINAAGEKLGGAYVG